MALMPSYAKFVGTFPEKTQCNAQYQLAKASQSEQ
jgi:hypothetical protein